MIIAISLLTIATILIAAFLLAPRLSEGRVVFDTEPDRPQAFGYQMSWLAIRTRDSARVVDVLGLREPEAANWQTGIGAVYDRRIGDRTVFVSPPVNGWTFVVGLALPQPMGRGFIDKCTPLLMKLGGEFIEAQYFLSYPPMDFHAWARVVDGRLVRAFAIGDEGIVWNKGKPTKEEKTLGLKLFELRGVKGRKGDAGGELILYPTEEHVMRLASRWSMDPTILDRTAAGTEPAMGTAALVPSSWTAERQRKVA